MAAALVLCSSVSFSTGVRNLNLYKGRMMQGSREWQRFSFICWVSTNVILVGGARRKPHPLPYDLELDLWPCIPSRPFDRARIGYRPSGALITCLCGERLELFASLSSPSRANNVALRPGSAKFSGECYHVVSCTCSDTLLFSGALSVFRKCVLFGWSLTVCNAMWVCVFVSVCGHLYSYRCVLAKAKKLT